MVKLVQKTIQDRRNSGISKVARDVVDVLLNDASEQLTDDLIADNMIDMMIPGEDSVPLLMTLATKYLSECPAALQQLTVCYIFSYEKKKKSGCIISLFITGLHLKKKKKRERFHILDLASCEWCLLCNKRDPIKFYILIYLYHSVRKFQHVMYC